MKLWELLKECWADILGVVVTGWLLYNLWLIMIYGEVGGYENNHWILWFELVFFSIVLGLFIERLIKDLR